MSSDTVLFDVCWRAGTSEEHERLVARLAPDPDAAPLFPVYDLERQYRVMEAVSANSAVPVPPLRGFEPDPAHVGSEFIMMERVDGVVPTDIPPYNFDTGWVVDATEDERARMERASVEVLAALHAIPDPETTFSWFAAPDGQVGIARARRRATRLRRRGCSTVMWVRSSSGASRGSTTTGRTRDPRC